MVLDDEKSVTIVYVWDIVVIVLKIILTMHHSLIKLTLGRAVDSLLDVGQIYNILLIRNSEPLAW